MKRFIAIILTGIAVAFGTASTAQAHDRNCYRPSYSHGYSSHGHGYSRGYSSGYSSHGHGYRSSYSSGYCQPSYRSYRSYNNCQPRYYSSGPVIRIGGFGLSFCR